MSKVCAIFGYGPGLSASIARKWSQEGFSVALLSRTLDKVQTAAAELSSSSTTTTNNKSKGYACDVSDEASVAATIQSIEQDLGPIDCIVYNAGSGVWKTWDQSPLADFDKGFRTNVSGLLKACQCIVPGMIARGHGFAPRQTRHGRLCTAQGSPTALGTISGA